jgi:hypothetical protein
MPVEGIPDPARHRICRRCQNWFEPAEGTVVGPDVSGPLSAMHAVRLAVTDDQSLLRFQCHRCSRVRRVTQVAIWTTLFGFIAIVLLLEKLGVLK